jgi:hypothetical protein
MVALYWYRYREVLWTSAKVTLVLHQYPVLSETPKGVWLDVFGCKRFVRADARKKYASPTQEEALESFHARKRRQVQILSAQLARAQAALRLTNETDAECFDALMVGQ